jgi:hypothetical protein
MCEQGGHISQLCLQLEQFVQQQQLVIAVRVL